jgi:hypothetical protein
MVATDPAQLLGRCGALPALRHPAVSPSRLRPTPIPHIPQYHHQGHQPSRPPTSIHQIAAMGEDTHPKAKKREAAPQFTVAKRTLVLWSESN